MADGFLGRWSRRKLDLKEGKPLEPEPPAPAMPAASQVVPVAAAPQAATAVDPPAPAPEPPPLTLQDVQALTPESDYAAFAGRNVDPQVRNAAMKKLFTDPHYNVMDRLDIYIDDYSQPDPMPASMLRQLASAKFLGFFADEEDKGKGVPEHAQAEAAQSPAAAPGGDDADRPAQAIVAQSDVCNAMPPSDADPDLRLQQDHAPEGRPSGGRTR
jgi:hypothetical protein